MKNHLSKCWCGEYPLITYHKTKTQETMCRMECLNCGAKDAPFHKSEMVALTAWETVYKDKGKD